VIRAVFTLHGYDIAGSLIGSRDFVVGRGSDNWLTLRASGMSTFLDRWARRTGRCSQPATRLKVLHGSQPFGG
jgi:hypothetical protein